MPYGCPSEGPKSGCRLVVDASIEAIQAALLACTGSREMSECQTLSSGKTEHVLPGGGMAVAGLQASRLPRRATATRAGRGRIRRATLQVSTPVRRP